jgi:hypothetical protein
VKPKTGAGSQDMGPTIVPEKPGIEVRPLIPIIPGDMPTVQPGSKIDPYVYWDRFYSSKDAQKTSPEKLRDFVQILNQAHQFREVHAALLGYLTHHSNATEPWMYEALAVAIGLNKGPAADIKKALYYAADRAQDTHNPNDLVRVADSLFLKGYYERVGPLLDEAMKRVPHRFEPIVMSINLAQKTKDPIRMADSIERLLSLGWPGRDEYFRLESRSQAERLARLLREDKRDGDAESLLANLAKSEARDVMIRLTWDGEADFDLVVDEPLGATAKYLTPRTVFGGSLITNGYGSRPDETYVCPRAFDGDYRISVSVIWTDPSKPVTRLTLETIAHEGTQEEKKQVFQLAPEDPGSGKPIVLTLKGGRRKAVLPYFDPVANFIDDTAHALVREAAVRPRKRSRPGGDRTAASKKQGDPAGSQDRSKQGNPGHPKR